MMGRAANSSRDDRINAKCVRLLCQWFRRNARDLPWRQRQHRSGYGALVAESMLQQTQVARVIESYKAFMRRFPTVKALAAADEQEVLTMWRGLGYYRRARNLHRAAKVVINDYGGRMPATANQLRHLPGVGRYTAGAIASIVHHQREPIVDGNVRRVLARWFAKKSDDNSQGDRWAWSKATQLVAIAPNPGVFNEALMELGATICTPRAPKCGECPVSAMCAAGQRGVPHEFPAVKKRANQTVEHHHAVVITRSGKVLLEQRNQKGMWAGMWQSPTVEHHRELTNAEVARALHVQTRNLKSYGWFDHHTTHRRIRFHLLGAQTTARSGTWCALTSLDDYPMSNAQRRVLNLLLPT